MQSYLKKFDLYSAPKLMLLVVKTLRIDKNSNGTCLSELFLMTFVKVNLVFESPITNNQSNIRR